MDMRKLLQDFIEFADVGDWEDAASALVELRVCLNRAKFVPHVIHGQFVALVELAIDGANARNTKGE